MVEGRRSWVWGCAVCVAVFIAVLEAPASTLETIRLQRFAAASSGATDRSWTVAQQPPDERVSPGAQMKGTYQEAIRRLGARGLPELCHCAGAADLLKLAQGARAAGDLEGTKQALRAIRRRFPGDPLHPTAGLTLGRLALQTEHDYPRAITWFQRYLRDEPQGVFAEEAQRGLIEARLALTDPAAHRARERIRKGSGQLARSFAGPGRSIH
jgi:hypothetical protein